MFNINDKTMIYVVSPAYYKTGGTELAHQLVYELNRLGHKAYIAYYEGDVDEGFINPAFEQYVQEFKLFEDVIDNKNNILILPEVSTELAERFSYIQVGIWWMSVDNFMRNKRFKECWQCTNFRSALKRLVKGEIKISAPIIDHKVSHFYQSEYARQFLLRNGVKNMHRLSDYINNSYFEDFNATDRDDAVLYNPRKGIRFTQKLIKASAGKLKWIPIQNMTTEEVRNLLRSSKIYVDFGNHPGKDRFPREAAISGCCVITGKRGAAKFYEDIAIPEEYKFDDNIRQVSSIVKRLQYCIKNYSECLTDFDEYRNRIRKEHAIFMEDVKDIFRNDMQS